VMSKLHTQTAYANCIRKLHTQTNTRKPMIHPG
jgi:hypothetical protein